MKPKPRTSVSQKQCCIGKPKRSACTCPRRSDCDCPRRSNCECDKNLVSVVKMALNEKRKKKRRAGKRGVKRVQSLVRRQSQTPLREIGRGVNKVHSGDTDQAARAIQQQNAQIVGHLSKQMEDIEQLKQVQNSLLESALRSSAGQLQNDIAKKTFTKGGTPSYTDSARLYATLTPSHRIKLSVEAAKRELKKMKEFMRQRKDKDVEGGLRPYTDAEIDALQDPSRVNRYYREALETQAQRAMLATHIGPGNQLPVTPVKQQLGDRRITSSNAKWLEGLGMLDDTLKQMVAKDDDEELGGVKANLFGGEAVGDEDDESDGYGGIA